MKLILLLTMLLTAALRADTVIIDTMMSGVAVKVTQLDNKRFRYEYTYEAWHSGLPVEGFIPVQRSGRIHFFRNDGGPVARRYFQMHDAKPVTLFKPWFRTPLDGRIDFSFESYGRPVLGRLYFSAAYDTPWGRQTTSQHSDSWIPGPRK